MRLFAWSGSQTQSRCGLPRGRIADRLDNSLNCVNHQLRFLDLNVVRALGCDLVFGVWVQVSPTHPVPPRITPAR